MTSRQTQLNVVAGTSLITTVLAAEIMWQLLKARFLKVPSLPVFSETATVKLMSLRACDAGIGKMAV